MTDYFAVIDLGTNTFHLIIGCQRNGMPNIIYRKRFYVKLARSGIGTIHSDSIHAAVKACREFREKLDTIPVKALRVLGTAALRTASNAPLLTETLENILGAPIEIISGKEEARLIARGVDALNIGSSEVALIMDIGGGSVEFIQIRQNDLVWSGSFPIGVAVLYHRFQREEPITPDAQKELHHFLDTHLFPLIINHAEDQPITLIGAAGIYEVLARCLGIRKSSKIKPIDLDSFHLLANEIISMDLKTRQNDRRIPKDRADLFPVALLLIRWVLGHLPVKQLGVSPYAMKEGALLELASAPVYSSS